MGQTLTEEYKTRDHHPTEKTSIGDNTSLRNCIGNQEDLFIFGTDNFSQFPRRDESIRSKCNRALAVARKDDIVVLRGNLDREYQRWLHSHGLGSENIVEYGIHSRQMTLSELIVNDPAPILAHLSPPLKKPVYVPWFSGQKENEAAAILGADLFGASKAATIKYNDKASFKAICETLGIGVVDGHSFEIHGDDKNYRDFEEGITLYLLTTKTVIIRGTMGEAGMSLYKTQGNDIKTIHRQIVLSGEKTVIIEPFLDVHTSPNDQWVIGRDGTITHIGMCEQICESGMVYIGTLKGKSYSRTILEKVSRISGKIVRQMSRSGYRGVIGIDYIITDEGIFPIENNARFNGSSYAGMIVENIREKLKSPLPFWKLLKTKTNKCSFQELANGMESILYDGKKTDCVFPYDCKALSESGNFAVILLAEDMDQITFMEKSLNDMGIKR